MSKSRVQITYRHDMSVVDVLLPSELVPAYLAPLKASGVFLGNSGGGRLDHVDGSGELRLYATIAVFDPPRDHVEYPHEDGYLHDCPGCEQGPCVCAFDASAAPCLSYACVKAAE